MYERWFLCLIIVAALAGCVSNKEPEVNYTVTQVPTPPPPHVVFPVQEPTTVDVEIFASAFNPPTLNVVNGTTVRWTNKDSATYVITGKGFKSPELNKRDNWSYTFNDTGTFEYNCSIHTTMPHGTIIVELPPSGNNS
ncbi:MAG: cupredoxin domain-containing protein [Candidatus Methanoperedens sp.]|nr:cupredoxin domain-containing protein [Candidatus Methanoperedens sp.]